MPEAEKAIEAMGLEAFFDKVMGDADLSNMPESEKRRYIAEWSQPGALTAMLNWYRASPLVVPPPGVTVPLPDALLTLATKLRVPTLVIWGMKDVALLPVQLDGLGAVVEDLQVVQIPDAGHFAPWEAPEAVATALDRFLTSAD
jgi:pimeloyl-ACP methyl ester carboxylesterase